MIEKITLTLFWSMMLLCAGSALSLIWLEGSLDERFVPTFFIIGLASFLIWAPLLAYRFLRLSPNYETR